MKKFYAFVAAALFSVATFASREVVPSDDDLASYKGDKTYAMCIYNESACTDIVLIGTYAGWNAANELEKFQAVEGFEGWYVVAWNDTTEWATPEKAGDGGVQAKPVQLTGTGSFSWDYQLGPDAELVRGTATLVSANNGTEVDIKSIGAGIVVIDVKSWKNNPCTAVYHVYNFTFISPDCNEEDYVTPAISGGFNNWAQDAMTLNELKTAERQQAGLPGGVFEYSVKAAEGSEYKFRSSAEWGKDWSNELKEYVAEDDEWKAFNDGKNFVLDEKTDLEFDLGDTAKYMWNSCEKPIDEDPEYVIVAVNVPANAPAAGVEIIGEFDSWAGTAMELLNTGWWFAEIQAEPSQAFKFREAGTWDNEIVYVQKISEEGKPVGLDNIKFKDVWTEDTYKGTPCKSIELDLSDPEVYVWKTDWVAPEGIEEVVLTEKAYKVVVDGILYIVRDNKMFNVQGAQVR